MGSVLFANETKLIIFSEPFLFWDVNHPVGGRDISDRYYRVFLRVVEKFWGSLHGYGSSHRFLK